MNKLDCTKVKKKTFPSKDSSKKVNMAQTRRNCVNHMPDKTNVQNVYRISNVIKRQLSKNLEKFSR